MSRPNQITFDGYGDDSTYQSRYSSEFKAHEAAPTMTRDERQAFTNQQRASQISFGNQESNFTTASQRAYSGSQPEAPEERGTPRAGRYQRAPAAADSGYQTTAEAANAGDRGAEPSRVRAGKYQRQSGDPGSGFVTTQEASYRGGAVPQPNRLDDEKKRALQSSSIAFGDANVDNDPKPVRRQQGQSSGSKIFGTDSTFETSDADRFRTSNSASYQGTQGDRSAPPVNRNQQSNISFNSQEEGNFQTSNSAYRR